MKKYVLFVMMCACISVYGEASPKVVPNPPHRTMKTSKAWKTKRVKIHGYDRARTVKRVRYMQGFDYYHYANRTSYLKMMGKAINGDRYYR